MPNLLFDRGRLLKFVTVMELALLAIAFVWAAIGKIDVRQSFSFSIESILMGLVAGLALAGSSTAIYWLGKFPAFKIIGAMRELLIKKLGPVFATITNLDIVIIALASGICEEVLFRGVIQQQFGLIATSILFGAVHTPGLKYIHYAIWATLAGLLLGALYQWTGTLMAPITAHVVNNLVGLTFLRWLGQHDSRSCCKG